MVMEKLEYNGKDIPDNWGGYDLKDPRQYVEAICDVLFSSTIVNSNCNSQDA